VLVIIDLTGIRDGIGPAQLLDMVEGHSKQAFKTWLAEHPAAWRAAVEVVAMDGFRPSTVTAGTRTTPRYSAHRRRAAHRQAEGPAGRAVRR
jgi:transposase